MLKYSNEKLATLIGVPIVTFILIWTIVIFHKNRRRWGPYDIVIVSIIIQSVLRNLAAVIYTAWLVIRQSSMTVEVCSVAIWVFNSVHTFQASSLTTLAVIALFSTKLDTKQLSIRQYLMRTHIVYHMFCLTTLCACVGVAAILAQEIPPHPNSTTTNFEFLRNSYQNVYLQCMFMPFQLDIKYSVFIMTLHIFLTAVSGGCLVWVLVIIVKVRRKNFSYLKKSSSDLSDLSLASMVNVNENLQTKTPYDTYTIHKGCSLDNYGNCCENQGGGHLHNSNMAWNSEPSATVSSSNSRRPCLNGQRLKEEDPEGTGLQTMYPVLTVCYLFNHIPVIVLCIFPWLIYPWPVAGAALWMAQLQDVLIPIGLGLVDSRFCSWTSNVYRCSAKHTDDEKLPQVGLDGKFRHFESQPQSLEINHPIPERIRIVQHTEPKFPITNGSLYTSIDGRLPIIHNYRRHKNQTGPKCPPAQSINIDMHSSHLKRQDQVVRAKESSAHQQSSQNVSSNQQSHHYSCYNNSDNHHINSTSNFGNISSSNNLRYRPSFSERLMNQRQNHRRDSIVLNSRPLQKRISLSHDSVRHFPVVEEWPISNFGDQNGEKHSCRHSRHGLGLEYRKSKSEDALNDLQRDLQRFKQNPEFYQQKNSKRFSKDSNMTSENSEGGSSDDDCFTDRGSGQDNDGGSQSGYSITTDGNCDFVFYQNNERLFQNNNKNKDNNNKSNNKHNNSSSNDSAFVEAHDFNQPTYNVPRDEYGRPKMTTFKPQRNQNQNNSNNNNQKLSRSSSRSSRSGSIVDVIVEGNNNYNAGRISRSSSKKSLENLQTYIEENINPRIQRSNSFVTSEYKCKFNLNSFNKLSRSNSILSDCSCIKEVKSGHLKNSALLSPKSVYIDDFYNHNVQFSNKKYQNVAPTCSISVPDFKKIFISEYL